MTAPNQRIGTMKRLIILAALIFAMAGDVVVASSFVGTPKAVADCGDGSC
jgi:hypothetical protein